MPQAATTPSWTVWPALLLAPLLALGQQSIVYALVTPSCARQGGLVLHLVSAAALLLCLLMTGLAWHAWRTRARAAGGVPTVTDSDSGAAASRPGFVALLATLVGALSTLVVAALWLPVWMLAPCS
jgi:hypothetical protein